MADEKPFTVRTKDRGVRLTSHDTEEQAASAAKTANEKAAKLGSKVQYEVVG